MTACLCLHSVTLVLAVHLVFTKLLYKLSMEAHACNPSTWKAKVGGLPQVGGQSGLASKNLSLKTPENVDLGVRVFVVASGKGICC